MTNGRADLEVFESRNKLGFKVHSNCGMPNVSGQGREGTQGRESNGVSPWRWYFIGGAAAELAFSVMVMVMVMVVVMARWSPRMA